MSLITDEIRAQASELYHGDAKCQEKSKFLLTEINLPNGLLPLHDIEECGYVKDTGFVWLRQKKKCEHKFEKIDRRVQYATEVTAYVEPNRIRKLTGVKTKELLLWVNLSDIYVDDPPTGKITFKTPTGLFRTFPVDAFQLEEPPQTTTPPVAKEEEEKEKEKEQKEEEEEEKVAPPPPAAVDEAKEEVKAKAPAAAAAATVEVKEV